MTFASDVRCHDLLGVVLGDLVSLCAISCNSPPRPPDQAEGRGSVSHEAQNVG
jgi:hypothetical protein